jgi:outer membrane protein
MPKDDHSTEDHHKKKTMKNPQLPLYILAVALGVLYFLHFKSNSGKAADAGKAVKTDSLAPKPLKIAYVDLDSLQEKYTFYQEKMNDFEKRKENADRDLNNAYQKLENERVAVGQKAQNMTQAELQNFQQEFQRKVQNLENQRRNLENSIQQEGFKTMDDVKKRINDFLDGYNKAKGYSFILSYNSAVNTILYKDSTLNITDEVVKGLNDAYESSKGKK